MDCQLDAPTGTLPKNQIIHDVGDADVEPGDGTDAGAGTRPIGYISYPNNVLAYDMNRPAGTAYYHKPRGSWRIKEMFAIDSHGHQIIPGITDKDV